MFKIPKKGHLPTPDGWFLLGKIPSFEMDDLELAWASAEYHPGYSKSRLSQLSAHPKFPLVDENRVSF